MLRRIRNLRHPSPAMVVALIALFVALGGTAGAVVAVPLALNSKKLQGKTLAQVTNIPGPATVFFGHGQTSLTAGQAGFFQTSCPTGQKVVSGGYSYDGGAVFQFDTFPSAEDTWTQYLGNAAATETANVKLYIVCVDT